MRAPIAAAAAILVAFFAPAAAAQQPQGPYAPWDGTNPFNCTLQNVGSGTAFPDPDADPFCVEFDKNSQNVAPNFGIGDFLANEPARVAAGSNKCFYYQTDHWTGSLVQGMPPELWHWDGQYFYDRAIGAGGVNLQNFRVAGQPASAADYGEVPPEFAPYMDQSGGGGYTAGDVEADPACAALVDTQAERDQIYNNGQPPPSPPSGGAPTGGAAIAGLTPNRAKRCQKKKRKSGKRKGDAKQKGGAKAAKKKRKRRCKKKKSKRKRR